MTLTKKDVKKKEDLPKKKKKKKSNYYFTLDTQSKIVEYQKLKNLINDIELIDIKKD